MSWQGTIIAVAFIAAGAVLGVTGHDNLAIAAISAVAGFVTGGLRKPSEPTP